MPSRKQSDGPTEPDERTSEVTSCPHRLADLRQWRRMERTPKGSLHSAHFPPRMACASHFTPGG
eukprot:12605581-Alexandrium_andersonii.AAC.1